MFILLVTPIILVLFNSNSITWQEFNLFHTIRNVTTLTLCSVLIIRMHWNNTYYFDTNLHIHMSKNTMKYILHRVQEKY